MAREALYDDGSRAEGFTGLLLHDVRVKTDNLRDNDATAGNSSYTQAGRRAGIPEFDLTGVADTSTTAGNLSPSMRLETTGDQDASSYHVKVLRGGSPGQDGATVVMRPALTSSEQWRGWNTHNVLSTVNLTKQVESCFTPGDSGLDNTRGYASCTAPNGIVLFAVAESGGVIRIERYDAKAQTFGATADAADPTVAAASIDTSDVAFYNTCLHGDLEHQVIDLLVLPTGRILLFALAGDIGDSNSVSNYINVMSSYSDDNGLTWRTGGTRLCNQGLGATSNTFVKMRSCITPNGSVLLLVEYTWSVGEWGVAQYASADMGQSFTLVDTWSDTVSDDGRFFDCATDPISGMIVVVYHNETSTQIDCRRIASPFTSLRSVSAVMVGGSTPVSNLAMYFDVSGRCYVTFDTGSGTIYFNESRDGGVTWDNTAALILDLGGANTEYDWDITVAAGAAIWMICDPASVIAGGTRSVFYAVHVGGWDTLTHPMETNTGRAWLNMKGFTGTWLPFRLPSSGDWTKTGAGTTALRTTAPFGVDITTAGDQAYYTQTITGLVSTGGALAFWSLDVASGGDVAADDIAVSVQMHVGGTDEWQCTVRFSTTQVRVIDTVGGTTIDTQSLDTTVHRIYKLAMRQWPISGGATTAGVTLYWRLPGSDEWTAIISDDNGLTRRVPGGASTAFINWGHISAAGTAESNWHWFAYGTATGFVGGPTFTSGTYGMYNDLALNPLLGAPYTLNGAPLPAAPGRLNISGGLYVHGTGGPATRGDTFKIVPRYDYPVSALDPAVSPSPAAKWRSTADNAVERFAWSLNSTYATQLGNGVIGVGLFGFNVPTALFRAWTGAAYTTLGTVDFRGGMTGLYYSLSGDTLTVDTGSVSAGPQWIAFGELVGATIDLGGGIYRKVRWNSEGAWTDTTTKRPTIHLDGITGAEATSGTMSIWYPDAILLVHTNVTAYDRYAIEISATQTADDYYEGGTIIMGPAVIFGHKYSRNRVIRTEPIDELTDAYDGTSTGRELNTPRRTAEASWVEGVDTSGLWTSAPAPDYLSARTGTTPIAARGDMTLLEGVVRHTGGRARTLCYIPRFSQPASAGGSANLTQLAGPERCWYGRLFDPVSRSTTNGGETKSEVVTATGFRFREEK